MSDRQAIPGYEGLYEADRSGRVYSLKKTHTLHHGGLRIQPEQTLKPVPRAGGFIVSLSRNNERVVHRVHHLIAMTFLPNPNDHPRPVHLDGDRSNNAVTNLEWSNQRTIHETTAQVARRGKPHIKSSHIGSNREIRERLNDAALFQARDAIRKGKTVNAAASDMQVCVGTLRSAFLASHGTLPLAGYDHRARKS